MTSWSGGVATRHILTTTNSPLAASSTTNITSACHLAAGHTPVCATKSLLVCRGILRTVWFSKAAVVVMVQLHHATSALYPSPGASTHTCHPNWINLVDHQPSLTRAPTGPLCRHLEGLWQRHVPRPHLALCWGPLRHTAAPSCAHMPQG